MPVIPTLGKLRQEDNSEFQVRLGYMVNSIQLRLLNEIPSQSVGGASFGNRIDNFGKHGTVTIKTTW